MERLAFIRTHSLAPTFPKSHVRPDSCARFVVGWKKVVLFSFCFSCMSVEQIWTFARVFKLSLKKRWLVLWNSYNFLAVVCFSAKAQVKTFLRLWLNRMWACGWLSAAVFQSFIKLDLYFARLQNQTLSQLKASEWILTSKVRWAHFFTIITYKFVEWCRFNWTIKTGNSYSRLAGSRSTTELIRKPRHKR